MPPIDLGKFRAEIPYLLDMHTLDMHPPIATNPASIQEGFPIVSIVE